MNKIDLNEIDMYDWDKQTKEKRLQKRNTTRGDIFAGVTFMVCVGLILLIAILG
jgi:hypothetical protein